MALPKLQERVANALATANLEQIAFAFLIWLAFVYFHKRESERPVICWGVVVKYT